MPKASSVVESPPVEWRDRIVGMSVVPISELRANPQNFRRHPIHQRKLFKAAASEIGFIAPILRNIRTGLLIDGHMRLEEAEIAGITELRVVDVDLDPEEEPTALLTLDAVSAMAFEDALHKAQVLRGAQTSDDELAEYFKRELERQEAEAVAQQDIDEIAEEFGEHDPRSFWPVIRMRVHPDVRARFMNYFKAIDAETDSDRLDIIMDRLKAPHVEAEEFTEVTSD